MTANTSSPVLETLADGMRLTESLRWHNNRLYFADVHAGHVFRLGADDVPELVVDLQEPPGGIGWLPDGSMLVVAQDSRRVLRVVEGVASVHADLSDTGEASLNDMWVDDIGRAYVGDMGFDIHLFNRLAETKSPEAMGLIRPGHVFVVSLDGTVQPATHEPLLFPNGVASAASGEILVAESFGMRVTAFAVLEDGTFGATRVAAALDFAPDGIAVGDVGIWVADPTLNRAVLVDAAGAVVREIACEHKVLDVALGGARGEHLYLATTAATDPGTTLTTPTARIQRAILV